MMFQYYIKKITSYKYLLQFVKIMAFYVIYLNNTQNYAAICNRAGQSIHCEGYFCIVAYTTGPPLGCWEGV